MRDFITLPKDNKYDEVRIDAVEMWDKYSGNEDAHRVLIYFGEELSRGLPVIWESITGKYTPQVLVTQGLLWQKSHPAYQHYTEQSLRTVLLEEVDEEGIVSDLVVEAQRQYWFALAVEDIVQN